MRASRGYWETREHGQFQLGNRGTKNVLGNTGTKRSETVHKKTKTKKDVNGTHLATFPLHSCRQICLHRIAAVVELGYEYKFTLGEFALRCAKKFLQIISVKISEEVFIFS